jgi:HpiC1 cyclase
MQIRSTINILQATTRIAVCSSAFIGLTVTAFAQSQTIPIVNPAFDSTVLTCAPGPSCFEDGVLPGWAAGSPTTTFATFKPSTGPGAIFPGGIPGGGPNVAAVGNGEGGTGVITQDLGFAPLPNTTYTLTMYVGQRSDVPLVAYDVELVVGTISVASDTTLRPAPGTFLLDTVSYSSGPSPGNGHLIIRLTGNGAGQADFTQVALAATNPGPTTQILPQVAFGGGWYTALYFTNISSTPVSFTVNFIGNDGTRLTVPTVNGSSSMVSLAAHGTALIEIPNNGPLVEGYASAALPAGVTGYGVFRQSVLGVNDQEAVVLLSGTTATTSTLLFDDTKYTTGVAVVNLASVSTTISVFAYDNHGNTIGTSSIPLAANAKTAVVLRDLPGLAGVAGTQGSVDFTASIGNLAVLGLRFNGLAFTYIPTFNR